MAQGKKLSFSLLVLHASDLWRLREGSLSNVALAACEESASFVLALSTLSAVRTTLCSVRLSPAVQSEDHTDIPWVSIDSMVTL